MFCRYLPFSVFGPFAGLLVDRRDSRRCLAATQATAMGIAIALTVYCFASIEAVWPVFVLAALSGATVVVDSTSRQVLTYQIVGRAELANAVSLNSSLTNLAKIVGPVIGGVIIALAGIGVCFAVNAAAFVGMLTVLLIMRPSELFPLDRGVLPKGLGAIREGMRYVWESPEIRTVMLLTTVIAAFGFNFRVVMPVLAAKTLAAGPDTLGVIFACFGAGSCLGALFVAARGATWRTLFIGLGIFSVGEFGLAPLQSLVAASVLLFVIGFGFAVWIASSQAMVTLAGPDRLRGRIMSSFVVAYGLMQPVSGLFVGWLLTFGGTQLALLVGGAAGLLAIVAAWPASRRSQQAARVSLPMPIAVPQDA